MSKALFPFQIKGAEWLSEVETPRYPAWDCGTGKSALAVAHADMVGAGRILVIAPAHGRKNWEKEFQTWQKVPRSVTVVYKTQQPFETGPRHVIVVSYDALSIASSRLRYRVMNTPWDLIVLDEAHMLGRNSERTRYILGQTNGLYKKAKRVLPLSGTPATKSASELYPLLRALWPHLVDGVSWKDWEDEFCRVKTLRVGYREVRSVMGTRPEKLQKLRDMLSPFMHVLKIEDVVQEIPSLRVTNYTLSPPTTPHHAVPRTFTEVDTALADVLNQIEDADDLASLETAFATQRRLIGLQKAPEVAKLLGDELDAEPTKKIVVFAWHREVLDVLATALDKFGVVRVDGSVSANGKHEAQEKFQTDPDTRVFIGQIRAASTNLTLTAAHDVVLAEASWTPGDNYQAIRRVRRIGQTKPVLARYMSLDGADDRINRVLSDRSLELDTLFASHQQEKTPDAAE